jgi:tRNA G10  N-methylase Trm11
MNLFINKKVWLKFIPEEMNQYKIELFNHYRSTGFPYFPTDEVYRLKEFKKLKAYNYKNLIVDDIVKQTMHGLALAWSFMPHSWSIQCGNMKTPLQVFNNDDDLKRVINKRLVMGSHMSDNGLRKMLKMYSGVQCVSNFRPTAVAAIYNKYAPNGLVWDMCAGFGGRLLGAIISGTKYIGTDPATETFNGLWQIKDMFSHDKDISLVKMCSENYIPEANSLDLCFTSPPYYNWEKYSNESTQSYIKHPSKDEWLNNFLGKTFANCYKGLKNDKKMIINIANTKEYDNLVDDTIKVAQKNGFILENTLKLALSNPNFTKDKHAFKYEPMLVFKKI